MLKHILNGAIILIIVVGLAGCSENKNPTSSTPEQTTPLAGGGRLNDDDPSGGRISDSNFVPPVFDSLHGITTLFYSYIDCAKNPGERIITSQSDWDAWWAKANSCLYEPYPWPPDSGGWDTMPWDSMPHDSNPWDSVPWDSVPYETLLWDSVPWDSVPQESLPWDSMPWDSIPHDSIPWDSSIDTIIWPDTSHFGAPPVNFDSFVVLVIALEPDSMTFGRSIWVDEVTTDAGGTVVRYTVSSMGEDCVQILMMPMLIAGSEVIAVMAPRPIVEPVTWIRTDTVYHCFWEPDPHMPITLYYTDTPCELGLGETVITDSASYAAWSATAFACDSLRWRQCCDSGVAAGELSFWFNPEVDFTTHAVIILRSGDQTKWGGGIWLDKFEVTDGGTTIDYTVMEPGEDCPTVGPPLGILNPTVAIRVPLPINSPITWNRGVQPIQCNWNDSSFAGSGGISGR